MNRPLSTNSRQTSEPQPSPQLEAVDTLCAEHGPYKSHVLTVGGNGPIMSRCPLCIEAVRAKEQARKEQEAEALRNRRLAALRESARIPARFADRTFSDYAATVQGQKIALGVCKAFAGAWPEKLESGASLVLTGGPGTGKTHLACAVANAVMAAHMASCKFGTVATILRHIKDTYRKDSDRTEQDAINSLVKPDLLVVDEVGVQVGSEHEKLLMFEVLNARYQELRPTILISNLSGNELEDFMGQRVMDRYRECGSILAFDWDSYRGRA